MKIFILLILTVVPLGQAAADPLSVFVSVLPQKYFVERLGGVHVDVQVLVGPGQSPATFAPKPRQMSALAVADLYYRIGVPFERALMPRIRAINSGLPVLDARDGIALRRIGPGEGPHGQGQDEVAMDPHVWLDPVRVRTMLGPLRDRLIALDPQNRAQYQANYGRFIAELRALEAEIRQLLEPLESRKFMVFHSSWGYFADTFGLQQVAIELEGKSPGARRLGRLIEQAEKERVNIIFVQPQFSSSQAQALAQAIGARVMPLDPLAEDYPANLIKAARSIGGKDNE